MYYSPKPTLWDPSQFSSAVYDAHHQLLRLTLSPDEKYRLFTPLARIDPQLIAATQLQEDQYFTWHWGVNPWSLCKATWQTYVLHHRRVGASTITMQLARMRFKMQSKTLLGKLEQIARALQLERHYSKNQILEAYLNLAPYGYNIEGVGAASLIYFGTAADALTLPQALTLSIIPQNPTHRVPKHTGLKTIRDRLFERWLLDHPGDINQAAAFQLPLAMQTIRQLPFAAPHFVQNLLQKLTEPQSILTTLDYPIQRLAETVTRRYVERKNQLGIHNAAVLIVDSRDMAVKGLVGSTQFFNKMISGQIDGTATKRSPGSTLKPFIYALALDQGLIHPYTVLKDVPRSFGSYNPENFDYDFLGPIKAKDALILSRNIPAIELASQLTHPTLHQLLEKAHVKDLKSESYYGLALSLGGAELTMQELTTLYAALVNDGVWHPLRTRKEEPMAPGERLMSPEASFLVLDMLKETPRPPSEGDVIRKMSVVSWKTGTSSGFRDAWAIGSYGPYVIAVWLGNFNNKGNPALVGKSLAAPLFFSLIHALHHEIGPLPIAAKNTGAMQLTQVDVCKASGMLPTRFCHDTEKTWFIPGKSPIRSDTIFREVAVDPTSGLRTCHINAHTRFEVFEFWPSDLLNIFKQAGIQRRSPPVYEPGCSLISQRGLSPRILSPQKDLHYVMRANSNHPLEIPLTAMADGDVQWLYWFDNDTYLTKAARDKPYLWVPSAGKHIIRVVDEHGLSDVRDVYIEMTT